MIILISPAKTFKKNPSQSDQNPLFIKESFVLQKKLKRLSKDQIKKAMKLSEKLATTVYHDYQHLNESHYTSIESYYGQVYKALNYETLNLEEKTYIEKRLYIISGLYGLVKPLDGISFYRLELQDQTITNLYEYWKPFIKSYLTHHHSNEIILSLCSNEYEKILEDIPHISINFDASENIHSMALKTLRGHFLREMAKHEIMHLEDLKSLKVDGFIFDPNRSTHSQYIFRRD